MRISIPVGLLSLLGLPALVAAQVDPASARPAAHAVKVTRAPVIDGRLDDSSWAAAAPLAGMVQHEPFDGQPATERTEIRIVFDGAALYIGARLYDRSPGEIIRGESRRDISLKEQDSFLILLDTFHDRQNAFVFGTTPAAVEHDGQVTKEGEGGFGGPATSAPTVTGANENVNWDGTWTVATSVDSAGWTAEFRIPFATLRYASGKVQTWGLNFARFIRRRNEEDFWAPIPRQHTLFRVSQAGTLDRLEPPGQRVALLTPYVLGSVRKDYLAGAAADGAAEVGFDAKLGVSQSLVADLTYNTDFAQVEVDEEQINLTRYNLFFPEKRPFFLENAGTFAFGTPQSVDLFFSRRIGISPDGLPVPIRGGARLSGRIGGLTVGLLDVQTQSVQAAGATVIPNDNYSVGRVVYELPHRSRIGAIVASRLDTDSTGDYNVTGGIDGKLGIGEAVSIDAYLAHSKTPTISRASNSFNLAGTYTTRKWEVGSAVRQVDPGFNPELGYLERPTFRFWSFRILRHLRTPGVAWFRETRPHITFRQYDDVNGAPQSRLLHVDSHWVFANGSFIELPGLNFTREALRDSFNIAKNVWIPAGVYDHFEWATVFNTNLSAPYSLSGDLTIGGFYTGHRAGGSVSITARPNDRFNLGLRLGYTGVRLPEGNFDVALVGVRLAYAFTPRIYLQSLTQYNNQTESLSANVRFGWLGPAGTGLFLVYNEGRATGDLTSGLLDRAFVVKFTRQIDLR
jgi:hypothetical protein